VKGVLTAICKKNFFWVWTSARYSQRS